MDRILITGASGPIGAALLPYLGSLGTRVIRLVRGPAKAPDQVQWDPGRALSPEVVSGCEVVIHLAGESIFGRWTARRKQAILESRVLGTTALATSIVQAKVQPRVFLCASAIGFYGNRGDEILTEQSSSGSDFPSEVCRAWEDASAIAGQAGIRTVNLRIGMVLSAKGGALPKMLTPFRFGLGGRLGSGNQWSSWIHVDDIVGAVHHLIENDSLSGPVNLVSPTPVTNAEFTRTLASVLHRPAMAPVPAFAIRMLFGEMGEQLLLSGQRVFPEKLQSSGYRFRFPELKLALQNLVG